MYIPVATSLIEQSLEQLRTELPARRLNTTSSIVLCYRYCGHNKTRGTKSWRDSRLCSKRSWYKKQAPVGAILKTENLRSTDV